MLLEEYYSQILKTIDTNLIISVTDLDGVIVYVNENFCKYTGYSESELIGQTHRLIKHPDNPDSLYRKMWSKILKKEHYKAVVKNRTKDNRVFYAETLIKPLYSERDKVNYYISIRKDASLLYKQKSIIYSLKNFNVKTKMHNEKKLKKDLNSQNNGLIGVFSINHLSDINAFYGESFTNELIQKFAHRFDLEFFNYDIYYIDNNRFAIFKGLDKSELNEAARSFKDEFKHITKALHSKIQVQEQEITITLTGGVSMGSTESILEESKIAYADALKNHTIKIYHEKMVENITKFKNNREKSIQIQKAIKENKVVPFFQPIYNNKLNKIDKFESLVRIVNDDGEILTPYGDNGFLKAAIKSKQYPDITKVVIEKAFEHFSGPTYSDFSFSINLSIDDIINSDTQSFIFEKIEKFSSPGRIIFEILEDKDLSNNINELEEFIKNVRIYGCKIALDDFGAGYSNFINILNLDIDILKFDGSLIREIDKDYETLTVVKSMLEIAKLKNIETVAEYVSSERIQNIVQAVGFNHSQGWYIGQPQNLIS